MRPAPVELRKRRTVHIMAREANVLAVRSTGTVQTPPTTNPSLLEHLHELLVWKRALLRRRVWWATGLACVVVLIPLLELLYLLPLTFILCLSPHSRVGDLWKDNMLPYLEWVEDHELDLLQTGSWYAPLGARFLAIMLFASVACGVAIVVSLVMDITTGLYNIGTIGKTSLLSSWWALAALLTGLPSLNILMLWGDRTHAFASSFSRFAHTVRYLNPSGFMEFFNPFRLMAIALFVSLMALLMTFYLSGISLFRTDTVANLRETILNILLISLALYVVSQFVVPPESSSRQKLDKARRRVFLWLLVAIVTVWYTLEKLTSSAALLDLAYFFGVVIIALDRLGSNYAEFSRRVEEYDPLTRISRSWRSTGVCELAANNVSTARKQVLVVFGLSLLKCCHALLRNAVAHARRGDAWLERKASLSLLTGVADGIVDRD